MGKNLVFEAVIISSCSTILVAVAQMSLPDKKSKVSQVSSGVQDEHFAHPQITIDRVGLYFFL